jgi:hypothetical protein
MDRHTPGGQYVWVETVMDALDRCLESVAFCHVQDEQRWAAARIIVQQDIDGYVAAAGAGLHEKRDALVALRDRFVEQFPDEHYDPVLIRSYIRGQLRKIEYELKHEGERRRHAEAIQAAEAEAAPATAPPDAEVGEGAERLPPESDDQLQDAQANGDASDDKKA